MTTGVAHGFLDRDGPHARFGNHHAPAARLRDIGFVICGPLVDSLVEILSQ